MYRISLSRFTLVVLISLYILGLCNFTFWKKAWDYSDQNTLFLIGAAAALFFALNAIIGSFAYKYMIKPVSILLILIAGTSAYFSDTFGTIIDKEMIDNTLSTNTGEAGELLTSGLILHLLVFVLLPILAIFWVRIDFAAFKKTYFQNVAFVTGCIIAAAALVLPNYVNYVSIVRNHRDLAKSLTPSQPISAMIKYTRTQVASADMPLTKIGNDAILDTEEDGQKRRPKFTVMVLGETARAQSFSLNGYERETNPELKKRSIYNFSNASSCGTATAVSVPCMFSKFGRENYLKSEASHTENVLDIIAKTEVQIAWFDNNSNSKGQADRIPYFAVKDLKDNPYCDDDGCYDEILLSKMKEYVDTLDPNKDIMIVLHQLGSHGPSYYKRSPAQYKKFLPECATAEISNCSREEILNSYDNTILYTDTVLAQIIDYLQSKTDQFNTAMLYMSDHGESTGENGIYLHGLPYFIAPEYQTKVPLIFWLSDEFQVQEEIDPACMADISGTELSQDNLFHTLLELAEVDTADYNPKLDIFEICHHEDVEEVSQIKLPSQ
ncbi:MAG: phosphoethanolamine--lipid A transferase [Salaquimonas sp.]